MQTKVTNTEEIEQITLFKWALFMENKYPELRWMYHVPNEGKRSKRAGSRLKQAGLKPGVPDIVLPAAHGGYFGLYIEMKVGRNKTTDNQNEWINGLPEQGYKTCVCYGWESASKVIEDYLKLTPTIELLLERKINNDP